jgi:hypothetical protein
MNSSRVMDLRKTTGEKKSIIKGEKNREKNDS